MSVWFAIPSCRPAAEATACFDRWRLMGYRIAVLRQGEPVHADLVIPTGEYLGWANSINILAKEVFAFDPLASWLVSGGDDYHPDPDHRPEVIAQECTEHFCGTFGVMQPTGHRWGDTPRSRQQYGEDRGAYIDRIAGSPWLGREWCRRAHQGRGPLLGEFLHMYGDEALQEVAIKFGVFWQRRDLTQLHDHWGLTGDATKMPVFMKPMNSREHWDTYRALFQKMKREGWPNCEPLPAH